MSGRSKLTAEEIARRNSQIVQDRLRHLPVDVIAKKHGVCERTVWTAWKRRNDLPALAPNETASRQIQDHIEFLEGMQRIAALETERGDQSSARVGFFREELRIADKIFEIRQAYGLIPQDAPELDYDAGVRRIGDKLREILTRRGIDAESVIAELMESLGSVTLPPQPPEGGLLKLVPRSTA